MPKLLASAGVLLQPDGDITIVVLGMGVIWRQFGDGVSMSERYLRMCMGVLPVLDALFGAEGLAKFCGSSGGERVASFNTGLLPVMGSSSSNTLPTKRDIIRIFRTIFFNTFQMRHGEQGWTQR